MEIEERDREKQKAKSIQNTNNKELLRNIKTEEIK